MYGKVESIARCVKYLVSGVSDSAFVCFNPTSFVNYAKRLEFLEVANNSKEKKTNVTEQSAK